MPRAFKTILCPTDFSAESYRAVEYGISLARLVDSTVLLAHVIHVPTGELFQPDGHVLDFNEAKARARALLEDVRQKHMGGYAKSELVVDLGDPYTVLMEIARQRHVDLIVAATHGRTALEHLVMGSVAEKIIRHAPCPVFVVRRGVD